MIESAQADPPARSRTFALTIKCLLALSAIALAALGQLAFTQFHAGVPALLGYAMALIVWVGMLSINSDPSEPRAALATPSRTPPRQISLTLAASATVLALLTFISSGGNAFTFDNVLAWFLSVALFLYVFWEPEKDLTEWRDRLRQKLIRARGIFKADVRISWRVILFSVILLVGAFFYYYRLEQTPAEMTSDHAEKLLDVHDVVEGARPIFFLRNTGREPIQFYLTAAFIGLTGHRVDYMALKWITATLGLLVVPLTFFLARELLQDETIAFIAAALVAISKWPLIIARIGLRFPLTPFFVAPTMYFLFRALKYQKRNDYLMLGLSLGAGLYGYNAFRIVPALVALYVILWLVIERNIVTQDLPRYITNAIIAATLALFVFMPLFRFMLDNPGMLWYRVLTRIGADEQGIAGNPLLILLDNIKNVVLMFNVTGDQAWPNNIPFDPALDFVTGGIFVLGVVTAVYRLVRYREKAYAHVMIVLFILLMPSALAIAFPAENPGNARAGGAIPFVFMLAALPLATLARSVQRAAASRINARLAAFGVVALIVLLIAGVNFKNYFEDYDASYRASSWNSSEIADAVRAFADNLGDVEHAWILLYPNWVDTRNVAINLGDFDWVDHTLENADAALPQRVDNASKMYILNPQDRDNLARLQNIFPNGQMRVYHSQTPDHDFVILTVPGTLTPDKRLGSGQ